MNYKAFNKFVEISSVKEGFDFIDMLRDCLQYNTHEVSQCFGLVEEEYDYGSEDENVEYTYRNPEILIGKWYVHLEEDFDRCGDVNTRMFLKIPDAFEPVAPITHRMLELEVEFEEISEAVSKLEDLHSQQMRNPMEKEVFLAKYNEIDQGRLILAKAGKIQRKQEMLCGDYNRFLDYTNINPYK